MPGARILEIGCGPGGLSRDLAVAGYCVTGIDRSKAMLRRAVRVAGSMENVNFYQSEAMQLPFDAQSFDAVIAASVINVVRDKRAFVSEMARVVRPGGCLSVLFPTPKFTPASAAAFARRQASAPFHSVLFELWAHKAPKLDGGAVMALFEEEARGLAVLQDFLEGQLMCVTCTKPA